MTKTVTLVTDLAASTDLEVSFVNLGGGLGIPYFPKENPLALGEVGETAHRAVEALHKGLGEVEVIMELGRYLVGDAGIYVTRVIDVKESRGMRFAVCDGGLHHHLAASGNFGQVIRKNYPVTAVTLMDEQETVSVVGPLCTPLDLLADRMRMSKLVEGSLVAVLQSGAYGRSASPQDFLSHPHCAELLV